MSFRVIILALSWFFSGLAVAEGGAVEWIHRVSQAMQTLTYQGTFVYLHGDQIESMRLVHEGLQSGERERLTSLNGEARVIIRDANNVTCIWPGSKSIIVTKSHPRTLFPRFDTENNAKFSQYYDFKMMGLDRVAGIKTQIVVMMPKDDYRYGYKLWIDTKSHLLLRFMLLDMHNKVIEQIMFTDLVFPEQTDANLFDTTLDSKGYQKNKIPKMSLLPESRSGRVQFTELPTGFKKISETMKPMTTDKKPVIHVVISDGITSVSAYVEYVYDADENRLMGSSSMGALSAYGRTIDGAYVTVVGEVPVLTVEKIGDAMQLLHK